MGSVLEAVEAAFKTQYGKSLLRDNEAVPSLLRRLHRFQAVKQDGILELAKDLTRLFMERIDAEAIAAQLSLSKNEKRPGSLKLLERLLSTKLAKAEAGKLMSPLFGIYDLRLADAHLGSARIESGRMRTGIDDTLPAPMQGRQLLHSFNETLKRVTGALV